MFVFFLSFAYFFLSSCISFAKLIMAFSCAAKISLMFSRLNPASRLISFSCVWLCMFLLTLLFFLLCLVLRILVLACSQRLSWHSPCLILFFHLILNLLKHHGHSSVYCPRSLTANVKLHLSHLIIKLPIIFPPSCFSLCKQTSFLILFSCMVRKAHTLCHNHYTHNMLQKEFGLCMLRFFLLKRGSDLLGLLTLFSTCIWVFPS